jgi:hypothetical protein
MSLDRAPVLLSAWLLVHYMALRHSVASVFASEALPCNEERLVSSICLARLTVRRSPFTAWRSALAKRGSIPSGELPGNDSFSVLLFAGKRLARVFCCDGADKGETKSTTRVRDQGLVFAKAKLPASHTSSCSLSQLTIRKHNHQGGEFMQSLGEAPMRRAH